MSVVLYETIAGFCIQTRWQAVPLSAQDLRDISDWCLLHMTEIEAKAEADILKQQQQQLMKMVEPESAGSDRDTSPYPEERDES